jgi:hypothetical protein
MNYTYDQETMKKRAFDFIYGCAMHDAILQKAFKGEKIWIGKIEKPKNILSEYICKVLNNEFSSQTNHDKFFLETANKICKEINSNKPQGIATDIFSFGNAQKLINITVKHMYTFCYRTSSLREGFRFCHCPVDAIMLGNVWGLCKGRIDLGKREFFCKSWGSEGIIGNSQPELEEFPARYALFQKAIRDLIGYGDIFPIEFDYIVWKA